MAHETHADLIVMGTHGRTGLYRLMAGSVATTVLEQAHCSVLALRAGNHAPIADEIRVVLHPTDFSKASEAALTVARAIVRDHGARLILLHVVPFDLHLDETMVALTDMGEYRKALDAIRGHADGADLKYPVATQLVRGFEVQEILQAAHESGCDMIVMGTHGARALAVS